MIDKNKAIHDLLGAILAEQGLPTNESWTSSGEPVRETNDGRFGLAVMVEVYDRDTGEHETTTLDADEIKNAIKELLGG